MDLKFFNKGGLYWLDAFGRPTPGSKISNMGSQFVATNCGIFTFQLVPVEHYHMDCDYADCAEYDNDNYDYNYDYIYDYDYNSLDRELRNQEQCITKKQKTY